MYSTYSGDGGRTSPRNGRCTLQESRGRGEPLPAKHCQDAPVSLARRLAPGPWPQSESRLAAGAGSKSRKTSMLPDRFAGGGDAGPLPSTLSISELSSGPYASPPGPSRCPGLVPGPVWPKKKTGVALSHFHAVAAPGNA
jgi:hypothetical protein